MRLWPVPLAGDIVWCHFPHPPDREPGPKPRPGLIVTVFDSPAQQYVVRVAYGTSQKVDQLYSGEFLIEPTDGEAFRLAGLSYATKFTLKNTLDLAFHERFFTAPPHLPHGPQPKLGTLHPSLMRRVRAAREA